MFKMHCASEQVSVWECEVLVENAVAGGGLGDVRGGEGVGGGHTDAICYLHEPLTLGI